MTKGTPKTANQGAQAHARATIAAGPGQGARDGAKAPRKRGASAEGLRRERAIASHRKVHPERTADNILKEERHRERGIPFDEPLSSPALPERETPACELSSPAVQMPKGEPTHASATDAASAVEATLNGANALPTLPETNEGCSKASPTPVLPRLTSEEARRQLLARFCELCKKDDCLSAFMERAGTRMLVKICEICEDEERRALMAKRPHAGLDGKDAAIFEAVIENARRLTCVARAGLRVLGKPAAGRTPHEVGAVARWKRILRPVAETLKKADAKCETWQPAETKLVVTYSQIKTLLHELVEDFERRRVLGSDDKAIAHEAVDATLPANVDPNSWIAPIVERRWYFRDWLCTKYKAARAKGTKVNYVDEALRLTADIYGLSVRMVRENVTHVNRWHRVDVGLLYPDPK